MISVYMALASTLAACRPAGNDGAGSRSSRAVPVRACSIACVPRSNLQPIFGGELGAAPGLPEGMKGRDSPAALEPPEPRRVLLPLVGSDLGVPTKQYRMPPRFLLHLGRLDGGPTRVITPDSDEEFAWAPDSKRFVYTRSLVRHPATIHHPLAPRTELVIARLDGSGEEVILDRSGIWIPRTGRPTASACSSPSDFAHPPEGLLRSVRARSRLGRG